MKLSVSKVLAVTALVCAIVSAFVSTYPLLIVAVVLLAVIHLV